MTVVELLIEAQAYS